jgi:hypothetical protein
MGRHDYIARPVESEDLAISVLEKADCPHDPLYDLDLLSVFLSFPEEGPAARDKGRGWAPKISDVRSKTLRKRFTILGKSGFCKH